VKIPGLERGRNTVYHVLMLSESFLGITKRNVMICAQSWFWDWKGRAYILGSSCASGIRRAYAS